MNDYSPNPDRINAAMRSRVCISALSSMLTVISEPCGAGQRQDIQHGCGVCRIAVFHDPHPPVGLSGQFGQLGGGSGMQAQVIDDPKTFWIGPLSCCRSCLYAHGNNHRIPVGMPRRFSLPKPACQVVSQIKKRE
jgi:hypothetical protein